MILNILGFSLMYIDKRKAIRHHYRISENTLLLVALLGGSIGMYLGMYCFHHKTNKKKFYLGIPLIFMIQIIIYFYLRFFML